MSPQLELRWERLLMRMSASRVPDLRIACQHGMVGEDQARAVAEQLLATAMPKRWRHVQAVAAETARLAKGFEVDHRALISAAWLHDIGYAPWAANTGFHPLDGARYLRSRRWDEKICRLVAHHTDAASQAADLQPQLSDEFTSIEGLERDVLWMADATTGPSGERLTLEERIAEIRMRYGDDHVVTRGMISSTPALQAAIARVESARFATKV